MSKNESRQERKKQKKQETQTREVRSGTSKIYYWIIGILFVILILLVLFIFNRSGNKINLEGTQDQTENIQEEDTNGEVTSDEDNVEETETPTETQEPETEEDTDERDTVEDIEDIEDETEESEEPNAGESITIDENLPQDTGYATDFSNGSSDRLEIKDRVMEVTGLGNDLIENWVGNDGPGRVVATVSSRDQTEHYEVYLQFGDGSWSVESYQRLSEIP